jgi:VWFA-related protein
VDVQPAPSKEKTQEADESGEFRIGVEVDLVDLIFTATDKHGRFIKDLNKDNIRLLDEGKPPLFVEAFESQTGLPLREDYTEDTNALAHGVRVLRPGGGTALHDAVFQACEKLAKAPVHGTARRAIILLSDGDDNQSRHTREEAIEAALRAEVIIYVISTNVTGSDKRGDKVLMRYAEATGGRVFFPLRIEEVSNAFAEIQDELRSQYVIAYKPENFVQDGHYHSIAIDVPGKPNVKIRARKGYYAPKGQL